MVTKKATTVDEQISLLESRKMKVADKQKAKEILLDIGYYRLGFYWFPFEKTYPEKGKKRSHEFVDETCFEDTVRVLRNLCAHGHNIFDLRLQKSIKRGMLSEIVGNECNNLLGAIRVTLYLLSKISANRSNDMKNELTDLICTSRNTKFYSVIKYLEGLSE